MSSSQCILILGGSGFIGTRLARLLAEKSIPVRIGDLKESQTFPQLWKECDVTDQQSLHGVLGDTSVIINLAAEHRHDVRPISRYHDVNVQGAVQVCNAARQTGVQQIIFTSSVAVYGFHPRAVDEGGPFQPFNEYGKTKLEAEALAEGLERTVEFEFHD